MSLLSRLFRSKAQKAVDALQDNLNHRLVAIDAGLKLFKKSADAFDASSIPEGSEEEASFKLAQGKHAYFTNALLDDLKHAEELIKAMQLSLSFNSGRPSPGFETDVLRTEKVLEGTDDNVNRLSHVTKDMLDIVGEVYPDDTQPKRKEDLAAFKTLLDHAKARKSEVDDTMTQMDKILSGIIDQYEETETFSDRELAKQAAAFMKAGTALSLAEGEWIDFLQKAIKAPSVDPFRPDVGRKGAWLEERWQVYNNSKATLQALLDDTDGGSA
ncbi:hypothetical protein [Rhizobium ruizarguesonis]|uniref:hypothetical protein n=2 Tax=Rhizobium ruizarguesonis TaxID=2081791 RepID=UPI0010317DAF|nr:hypothetical protein [Rhizobium ruizarguesonis]MBY5854634.1 hypothetical protein [Rhizobium leguminosarum]MBY5889624.1 hypothetical protein [Rhizobium leguminosarum]QSZ00520.1 hypothetical protein J3P73_22295 [Rhizobium ruizarguesonis]TAY81214.1 hypothetical protein ELH86_20640 [Rhizobium ruizarguesonis]TAZ36848.1 hypothetical protein ELH80_21950 [Rhizobium ruizarguesonis]